MKIEKIYDEIAASYNQKISAEILLEANNEAYLLITDYFNKLNSVLALGVGDGVSMLPYTKRYPQAKFYALDLSENMLEKTKQLIDCETFHGNIAEASTLIPKTNFDLILAHFVSAYVPIPITLAECKKMLSDKGIVSLVTNTMMSFSKLHIIEKKLQKSYHPFNKLVYHHIKRSLQRVYVPSDLIHLQSLFKESGFRIVELNLIEMKIKLESAQDVFDFFIEGGWFANGLMHPWLSRKTLYKIIKYLIKKHIQLPFEDSMYIAFAIGGRVS